MGILGIYASQISGHLIPNTSGTTWTSYALPSSQSYWTPCIGTTKDEWGIAGGTKFQYSSNLGQTWTERSRNLTGSNLAFGAGKWVVATYTGNTSCVEYSSDNGATWTTGSMPTADNWDSMIFAQSRFFAVSYGTNTCATSTNGSAWTGVTMPTQTNARRTSVSYSAGLGMWITTSRDSSHFDSSPDGITWTARTAPFGSSSWYGSAGNANIFVAIVNASSSYGTSTNGTSWTSRTLPFTASSVAGGESYNGTFIVRTSSTATSAYTSTDGINWTSRTLPSGGYDWQAFSKTQETNSNVMMTSAYGAARVAVSLQ